MKIEEAKKILAGRTGWLGIDETGSHCEYSVYRRRPLTTYAYRLSTEAERDKAAEALASMVAD